MSAKGRGAVDWRFSPSIVKARSPSGGLLLLGPGLSLFEVDRLPHSAQALSPEAHDAFVRSGLLVPSAPVSKPRGEARVRTVSKRFAGTIVHPKSARVRDAASRLQSALARIGGDFEIASAEHVAQPDPPRVILWMSLTEPTSPLDAITHFLDRGQRVLWFAETSAGLQVGPIFETARDVHAHVEATLQWGSAKHLQALGFRDAWALSLVDRVLADADRVAAAIRRVLASPRKCVLLPSNRLVVPWTELRARAMPFDELRRTQRWPKGLFSNLHVERMPGGGFLATCTPPCRGIADLEGCNGKGLTRDHAVLTAMGESIERFAAAEAGMHLPEEPPAPSDLPLSDFHPRGDSPYEAYLDAGSPPLPGFPARDELSGRSIRVPECLVPFPYLPLPGRIAFASDTGGLAAFPSRAGAVMRGALEIIERNNLYPSFMQKRPALTITADEPSLGPSVCALIEQLVSQRGARVWLLEYPEPHRLPIVHAFVQDTRYGHLSRGTGSGLTVGDAAERALLEASMCWMQHEHLRKNPELEAEGGFVDWASPAHVHEIVAYLDQHAKGSSTALPAEDEPALFARVQATVRAAGVPLLVADLPCPVEGWSAVRVLLPGLTCHAHASRSAGGRALLGAPWRLQIPT